jgi:membrane associated rhomboid family serine protease
MYLLTKLYPIVEYALLLVPAEIPWRPWTVVTYMFLHANLWHIGFNMLALYFFGPRLEMRLGGRHFLTLYFVSGIAAAIVSVPFTPHVPIVGASGAIFGVLVGFARFWPREPIYIWGILPIEARWLVALTIALSLYFGVSGSVGGIAHFAHLGGIAGGFGYLKWIDWRSPARMFKKRAAPPPAATFGASDIERWRRIRRDEIHPLNREELDRILDKIGAEGIASLTPDERAFLERFSAR